MILHEILTKIGIYNFRDRAYLEKIVSCECEEADYEKIAEKIGRDTSTVRKRVSKIFSQVSTEQLKNINIEEDSVTNKKILQGVINASRDI